MINNDNSELERAWQYLISKRIKQLPFIKKYSYIYIQHLSNHTINSNIINHRSEISNLFNDEFLNIVEILAEIDVINQLKKNNQECCHISHKLRHVYSELFLIAHSYRPIRNNLLAFWCCLYDLIENRQIDNINSKASKVLGVYFALYIFTKYFSPKKNLH